jgi:hypothetical protein
MFKIKILALTLLVSVLSTSVSAVTIIKFDLGGTGPDVSLTGGVFATVNDGIAGTTGDQNTRLDFTGFLDGLFADINTSTASLSIAGVTVAGLPNILGTLVTQATTGGTFAVYNPSNTLLLSGTLSAGAIVGSTASGTGSFFNTNIATFTGGSLLAHVATTPAEFSISFTNVLSGNFAGMVVSNNTLQNFSADATGQIAGAPVPEPASVALLLSGVLGAAVRRRKMAA